MKKLIIPLIILIGLAGCNDQTQVVTTYKYMVVHPTEAMYYCPVLKEFPNWKTLTDSQVAKTIVQLHKNNLTCKDRKSTRLNSSHTDISRMPSSA